MPDNILAKALTKFLRHTLFEREDALPITLHADHGPALLLRLDHLLWRYPVHLLGPRAREVLDATGDYVGSVTVSTEEMEHFKASADRTARCKAGPTGDDARYRAISLLRL